MNDWLIMLFLAAAPFTECRGAIAFGLSRGLYAPFVFLLSVLVNILVIPVIFWFLRIAHFRNLVDKILGKHIERKIEKNRKKFEVYEELALFGFVAIPFVGTGAYTGALLAKVLNLSEKKSFKVIALGVIAAGILVFLGVDGILFFINGG